VRVITSKIDIVWSSDGLELKRTKIITVSLLTNDSVLYTDLYIISQLSTADEDRIYECTAMVAAPSTVIATNDVILNVTG